jgi:hypothetical protein
MTRRLVPILAVTIVAACGLYRPALAAEPSGPSTPAAPRACSGVTPLFSPPATLSPAPLAAAPPIQMCGCGSSACLGKDAGNSCGTGLTCAPNGHCADSPAFWSCVCIE